MAKSKIEWTEETWNPVTGCTRVSAGCDNCYAARMSKRMAGHPDTVIRDRYSELINPDKDHFNGNIKLHDDVLSVPLRWKKPRVVFVNSMSDLFHPGVPFDFIDDVFAVMAITPRNTYQVLTKRPERMEEYLSNRCDRIVKIANAWWNKFGYAAILPPLNMDEYWPLPNVWLGTSVEDQAAANERIPRLLQCPAAVRFLSCEPLLDSLEITHFIGHNAYRCECGWHKTEHDLSLSGYILKTKSPRVAICKNCGCRAEIYRAVDQVIVGGESGPGARPMHPDWARSLRDQCNKANVPFFFKQWGEWVPHTPDWWSGNDRHENAHGRLLTIGSISQVESSDNSFEWLKKAGKKKAGRLLDGREWNEMPNIHK